ncbi:MAG: glycosyltransferase family 39 protein, partial [Anaerolineae bacterium]|nr:glycosyltransferase family 39 protein [Anaerolineae bacterium]
MIGGWTRAHWLVVGCCLGVFVAAGLIADWVFERVPHLEDEVAYLFQAQVFAAGKLYVDAPFHTNCFFAPFVLDHQGHRFGKYSPGWPALLAVGVRLGQPWWVNAGFAALAVALTFRLGREVSDRRAGIIAAVLAATSPFVLLLAGSLMSHTSCLAFTTAFVWCFRRSVVAVRRSRLWALVAGVMLGAVFAIRPYTALAVGFPALLYGLWRLWRAGE